MSAIIQQPGGSDPESPMSDRNDPNVRLFYTLPSDIILEIFTRLTRADSLRCMQVCRAWYKFIPQYVQDSWSNLKLYENRCSLSKKQVWLQFVGKHVKRIEFYQFKEESLYNLMQILVDHGCTQVEELVFEQCTTEKQSLFLALLQKLVLHVVELKIQTYSSIPLFDLILESCPKLKRFTFDVQWHEDFIESIHSRELPVIDGESRQGQHYLSNASTISLDNRWKQPQLFDNLLHLSLCCELDAPLRLLSFLPKCPNLRSFKLSTSLNDPNRRYNTLDSVPNLDTILTRCPKLVYLDIYTNYYGINTLRDDKNDYLRPHLPNVHNSYTQRQQTDRYIIDSSNEDDNNHQHLEYISIFALESYDLTQVLEPFIIRNTSTLKHLVFGYSPSIAIANDSNISTAHLATGWSSIFRSPLLSIAHNLRTLVCDRIPLSSGVIVALEDTLPYCINLETLVIRSTSLVQIHFRQFFENCWARLQHFELDRVNIMLRFEDGDRNALLRRLQQQADQFNIQVIRLDNTTNVTHSLLFTLLWSSCPYLKEMDVTLHPGLCTTQGIRQLGRMLRQNAPSLENIHLASIRYLPYAFLVALGHLSLLKKFEADSGSYPPLQVDMTGLKEMLDKSMTLEYIAMNDVKFIHSSDISSENMDCLNVTNVLGEYKDLGRRYHEMKDHPFTYSRGFCIVVSK